MQVFRRKHVMKNIWLILLTATVVALLTLLVSACTAEDKEPETNTEESVTINVFQYKVEIAGQLETLASIYESTHPGVKLNIVTNAGRDYQAMLRNEFSTGNPPDIYNLTGYEEVELWQSQLEDLSDSIWIDEMVAGSLEAVTLNNRVYGMPYNLEGYGIIYNKDIFKEVGISKTPATLDELIKVCNLLEASGYQPFYNAHQEWWTISLHSLNTVLGMQSDPQAYIDAIAKGDLSFAEDLYAQRWLDYLDVVTKYGQSEPFMSGYSSQIDAFVSGEAAMIQQGNWIQTLIDDSDIEVGLFPIPIELGLTTRIPVGVPSYWCVNSESEVKEEAKAFLEWLMTSDAGRSYLIEEFGFLPPYKTEGPLEGSPLGDQVIDYYKSGNYYGWYWTMLPEGYTNLIYSDIKEYLKGDINRDSLFEKMDEKLMDVYREK